MAEPFQTVRAPERSLRRYIGLLRSLDHVMDAAYFDSRENQNEDLEIKLIRTWGSGVVNSLRCRSLGLRCTIEGKSLELHFGKPDPLLWSEADRLRNGRQSALVEDGDLLLYDVPETPKTARLTAILRHYKEWKARDKTDASDTGWVIDAVELLERVLRRAHRRTLERVSQRITNRQTMLKELKPNSLYYNLLHALGGVVGHDYSSLIVSCQTDVGVLAAEVLRYALPRDESLLIQPRPKSARIGGAVPLSLSRIRAISDVIVCSYAEDSASQVWAVCKALYGSDWGAPVQSVMLVPIDGTAPSPETQELPHQERLLVALADSRLTFFTGSQQRDVAFIAKRTSVVIANSVAFSAGLEASSRSLDRIIIKSNSRTELIQNAARWLSETLKASCAAVLLPDGTLSTWPEDEKRLNEAATAAHAARVFREDRPSYSRFHDPAEGQFEALFGVPLRLVDADRGAVICYYDKARQPSPFDRFLLDVAAQRIAAALSVRAIGDRQLAELEKVMGLMERVAAADDDQALLGALTTEARSVMDADYCFVSIPDHLGELHVRAKTWDDEFVVPKIEVTGKPGHGITGFVAINRTSYRTGDVSKDPYYKDVVTQDGRPSGIRSEMAAPLIFEGRLLGVIDLMSKMPDAFPPEAETMLKMSLTHSAVALAHSERARVRHDHMRITRLLHGELLRLESADAIYDALLDAAVQLVTARHPGHEIYGNLYVKHPSMPFLEAKAFKGVKSEDFSPTQYLDEGVVGVVARNGEPLIIANTADPPPGITYKSYIKGLKGGSEIAVPMVIGTAVDAVINLESATRSLFGDHDRETLQALAAEVSLAVRFVQLTEVAQADKRRQEASRERAFLRSVSHQVARSAQVTSLRLPKVRPLLEQHADAMDILEDVIRQADRALELERRLQESFARPKDDYAAIDIVEVLEGIVEDFRRRHPEVDLVLDVHATPFDVIGTPETVGIIFENLFDNAISAMNGKGRLAVVEQHVPDQNVLVLDVVDTGHGIPDEKHERIWDVHFSDDGTGRTKGAGIGLWLVRYHLARMNSNISLHESAPGQGTTFRLSFALR